MHLWELTLDEARRIASNIVKLPGDESGCSIQIA